MTLNEAVSFMREKGHEITPSGRMRCVFPERHNNGDIHPSLQLYQNRHHNDQLELHCFGCGASLIFEKFKRNITENTQFEYTKDYNTTDLNLFAGKCNAYFLEITKRVIDTPGTPLVERAVEYLSQRIENLIEIIDKFQIGFTERENIPSEITSKNSWSRDIKRKCFITFPIYDNNGNLINILFEDFLGRAVKDNPTKFYLSGHKRGTWFSRKINDGEMLIITESIYDSITADLCFYPSAATLGKPTDEQINNFKTMQSICLAFDNDHSGQENQRKFINELSPSVNTLKCIRLPDNIKDLNQLYTEKGIEEVGKCIENAIIVDRYPTLKDALPEIINAYNIAIKNSVKIPREFEYSEKFLPHGFLPGLYGLAGIPEIGKTGFMNQLADNLAMENIYSVYILSEEPRYRLLGRTASRLGMKDLSELSNNEGIVNYRRVFEVSSDLYYLEQIDDLLRHVKKKIGPDQKIVVFIDSFHAMNIQQRNNNTSFREENTEKVKLLASLSKKYTIPIIFSSFIARINYEKEPTIGIFKESGDIEYLIDVGICLWSDKNVTGNPTERDVKLYFIKNRFGILGDHTLTYYFMKNKFEG